MNGVADTDSISLFQQLLSEVIADECAYGESLALLIQAFWRPAKESTKLRNKVGATELSTIFFKVEELHKLHVEVLQALSICREKQAGVDSLLPSFSLLLSQFYEFLAVVKQSPIGLRALQRCKNKSRNFQLFIAKIESYAHCKLTSLLTLSHGRVSVYLYFFNKLEQQFLAELSVPQQGELRSLLQQLNQLSDAVEAARVTAAEQLYLLELDAKFTISAKQTLDAGFKLVVPNRKELLKGSFFLLQNVLSSIPHPNDVSYVQLYQQQPKCHFYFLFNDVLVLSSRYLDFFSETFSCVGLIRFHQINERVLLTPCEEEQTLPTQLDGKTLRLEMTDGTIWKMVLPNTEERDRLRDLLSSLSTTSKKLKICGLSLNEVMQRRRHKGYFMPKPFQELIDYMLSEEKILCATGLFRVNGSATRVKEICQSIDSGHDINWANEATDPHLLASILKYWLRTMPEPLIPWDLYHECMASTEAPQPFEVIRGVIARMPPLHRFALHHILVLLFEVASSRRRNLMNVDNLGLLVGPNLLRSKMPTSASLESSSTYGLYEGVGGYHVMKILIANHKELFEGVEEERAAFLERQVLLMEPENDTAEDGMEEEKSKGKERKE
ncbi:Rho GTPase activating protein 24 [Balamuthia mandrillaris]